MQDLQGLSSRAELEELLALARARLPEPWRSEAPAAQPPLGFFFDPLPAPGGAGGPREPGGGGEKRKRVQVDDYEMEGGEGGDLNVTRLVRANSGSVHSQHLKFQYSCPAPFGNALRGQLC
jgi:hypothetical protein